MRKLQIQINGKGSFKDKPKFKCLFGSSKIRRIWSYPADFDHPADFLKKPFGSDFHPPEFSLKPFGSHFKLIRRIDQNKLELVILSKGL
jgi:hypothetical protein